MDVASNGEPSQDRPTLSSIGPGEIARLKLAVLVTDIRKSTAKLRGARPQDMRRFLSKFSGITLDALRDVGVPDTYRQIGGFAGDGFYVYLEEPNPTHVEHAAAGWAINAALRMCREFALMCDSAGSELPEENFKGLRLACGITFEEVTYGDLTGLAWPYPSAVTSGVVHAFRLAQKAPENTVLVSEGVYLFRPMDPELRLVRSDIEIPDFEGLPVYEIRVPSIE